jgi:hypothetical protein
LLTLTAALPACGDDGGGGGSSAPTKAEFVRRACAIQVSAVRKLDAASRASGRSATARQFVHEQFAPIVESSLIRPLDALTPPEGDERELDAMIAAARQALVDLKAKPQSVTAEEGSAEDPFRRFNQLTNDYGLICTG